MSTCHFQMTIISCCRNLNYDLKNSHSLTQFNTICHTTVYNSCSLISCHFFLTFTNQHFLMSRCTRPYLYRPSCLHHRWAIPTSWCHDSWCHETLNQLTNWRHSSRILTPALSLSTCDCSTNVLLNKGTSFTPTSDENTLGYFLNRRGWSQ